MKFANLIMTRKGRCTVGDDIQLLAIENLYKYMGVDYEKVVRIPLDKLATYDGEYVVLPLSFPFYGFYNGTFITKFSDRIIPVFLGFATLLDQYKEEDVEYLKKYQPIGCRDQYTMETLRKHNIIAYLNGCMTITFPRKRQGYDGRKKIFCVDIPEEFVPYIPQNLIKDCVFTHHVYMTDECPEGTEEKAKKVYGQYIEEAKMVVTTRLHAALPCVAAGIPVVLAKGEMSSRFPMIKNLIPVYTEKDFADIDWNPVSIDCEDVKEMVLQAAASRLWNAYNKYKDIFTISEFYERDEKEELFIDGFTNTKAYLKSNFSNTDEIEYALWGITQNAQMVHNYLKENFINARLKAVIDKREGIEFCGLSSVSKEWFKDNHEIFCFVCAGAAMPEAKTYFASIHHEKVYYCWADGLPR